MELKDYSIQQFTDELSGPSPVPGGGAVSALLASQGAALSSMVISLTLGKKKYSEYEEELKEMQRYLLDAKQQFLEMMEEDKNNFLPLSEVYRLPTNTYAEREYKEQRLEKALLQAVNTPMDVLALSVDVMEIQEELTVKGSRLVQSDVACGVECMRAAQRSALWNVLINTKLMKDREVIAKIEREAYMYMMKGESISQNINAVMKKFFTE